MDTYRTHAYRYVQQKRKSGKNIIQNAITYKAKKAVKSMLATSSR